MSISIVKGDLLNHNGYIAHQCNASIYRPQIPSGLACQIFEKYENNWNMYNQTRYDKLGDIIVHDNVINMIAQRNPGFPNPYKRDGSIEREKWFAECLGKMQNYDNVAFPWRIGSNLAGGDWDTYMDMIIEYCVGKSITIYKL